MATSLNTYAMKTKTLNELKDLIFTNNKSVDLLEDAILINGFDLMTYFPAKYQDKNKKALLDDILHNKKYTPSHRDILITRFYPSQLPDNYTYEQHNDTSKNYQFIANVFDYKPADQTNIIEWHMNFANCDIFSYYDSSLLAQDELQVLECPQLASLREYLVEQSNNETNNITKTFNTRVYENDLPYPILISNTERVINLNTTNLYGNSFSSSSKSMVLKSYEYLDPPQTINIIAIEAPKYGTGTYTNTEIRYILQACYTAYAAARILSDITYELNSKQTTKSSLQTIIHTGWFGCGAYGGNRTIMIVLQILAARMADIDKLIFHTVTNDCQPQIKNAETCLKNLFKKGQTQLTTDEVIKKILGNNFQWGLANGT